ncbi:hypothetical protein B0F90DRAFT_1711638 [Multifurca ochricompacta]|uniref:Carboxymuconolactone decarboxylase n=1 Tax=Multifurca ochricompacta TaxID=376703 RepID=A0AAD4QNF5_9AGAM|nr:hypothetical protein B0F90DRAFT_1711638 [Multifurca ochricompacta]
MADPVSDTNLQYLKSLYPYHEPASSSDVIENPWYLVVIVTLTAGNRPEAVPLVYKYVLDELERAQGKFNVPEGKVYSEKLLLSRKFRDAIFKCGMIAGYSKAINALASLLDATLEELRDTTRQRETALSLPELEKRGQKFFRDLYGETADDVQKLLDRIYPDMGWFSNTIAYGSVYGYTDILNQLETSYVLVGALIAADTPRQINWHLNNARRAHASFEQTSAVRQIAIKVSQSVGVSWRDGVPEVKE